MGGEAGQHMAGTMTKRGYKYADDSAALEQGLQVESVIVAALLGLQDCGSELQTLRDGPAKEREHVALGTENSSRR